MTRTEWSKDDTHRIEQCTTAIQAQEVIEKGVTDVFQMPKKTILRNKFEKQKKKNINSAN